MTLQVRMQLQAQTQLQVGRWEVQMQSTLQCVVVECPSTWDESWLVVGSLLAVCSPS